MTTIEIANKTLELSRRSAFDVLNLSEFVDRHKESPRANYIAMAQAVSDSLQATARRSFILLRWLYKWRYRKYTAEYLMDAASAIELATYSRMVLELDGIVLDEKKKNQATPSAATLQDAQSQQNTK